MGVGGTKNGVATSQGATFSIISKTLGEFLLFPVAHRHVNRLTSHNGIRGHQPTTLAAWRIRNAHFDKYLSLNFSSSREKTRPAYEFAWLAGLASNRIDECVHLANSTT
jgi:hypothetical protein